MDKELSEISCGSQKGLVASGSSMDPNRIDLEKHSLMNDVELLDFCHEYQRHASPGWQ